MLWCSSRAWLPLPLALLALSLGSCQRPVPGAGIAPVGAAAAIQADRLSVLRATDAAGFESANAPRTFEFPQDHGPHPLFATNGGISPASCAVRVRPSALS